MEGLKFEKDEILTVDRAEYRGKYFLIVLKSTKCKLTTRVYTDIFYENERIYHLTKKGFLTMDHTPIRKFDPIKDTKEFHKKMLEKEFDTKLKEIIAYEQYSNPEYNYMSNDFGDSVCEVLSAFEPPVGYSLEMLLELLKLKLPKTQEGLCELGLRFNREWTINQLLD